MPHFLGQHGHFVSNLRQRCGIASSQLADAGEVLRNTVLFALHGCGEACHPFVVLHEGLDLVRAEPGILGVELGVQVFLRCLELGFCVCLSFEPGSYWSSSRCRGGPCKSSQPACTRLRHDPFYTFLSLSPFKVRPHILPLRRTVLKTLTIFSYMV